MPIRNEKTPSTQKEKFWKVLINSKFQSLTDEWNCKYTQAIAMTGKYMRGLNDLWKPKKQSYMAYKSSLNIIAEVYWLMLMFIGYS